MKKTIVYSIMPALSLILLLSACGQSKQSVDNEPLFELQTQSAMQVITLEVQSTQIWQNIATMESQSIQINEQFEIISLQETLEYQSILMDEQGRLNAYQTAQIKNLREPNWLAIFLSIVVGPTTGITLIYIIKNIKRQRNQIINPQIKIENHDKINQNIVSHELPISVKKQILLEPNKPEHNMYSDNNPDETIVKHTDTYTRRRDIIYNKVSQNNQNKPRKIEQNVTDNIEIDFAQVAALNQEAASITERLLEDTQQIPENNPDISNKNSATRSIYGNAIDTSLYHLSIILQSEEFKNLLFLMWQLDWKAKPKQLENTLSDGFLNVILDKLNEQSVEFLGDNLIYDKDGTLFVTEEFREPLTKQFTSDSPQLD